MCYIPKFTDDLYISKEEFVSRLKISEPLVTYNWQYDLPIEAA